MTHKDILLQNGFTEEMLKKMDNGKYYAYACNFEGTPGYFELQVMSDGTTGGEGFRTEIYDDTEIVSAEEYDRIKKAAIAKSYERR